MENNAKAQTLNRSLGLAECVTTTAGAVIGVGLFTVGSQIVGLMGGTVIVASLISFVLILFPCAMYGEMVAALPLAGGTYSFAKRGLNYPVAVFESWNYTLAQVGIGASEAMAFSNYFVRLLNALGLNVPIDNNDYSLIDYFQGAVPTDVFLWKVLPAIGLFILFTVISYRGIEMNGKTQNFFMFFFWACSLVWFATVIAKVIELAWALLVMMKKDSVKIRLGWAIRPDKVLLRDFWKYTAPILGDELMWGLGFTMYSVIMGHMGSDAAAANSIANIVKNLVICFCTGIATASGIMVGSLLGQGELEKAKEYGRKLSKTSIFAGVIAGVIILGVIPFTPLFSTLTDTAKGYLRVMLVVCSYYVIGKSINMTVISGIFAAGGDSKFGFICDGITMWCVTVPIGLIAAFVLKLPVLTVYILINVDEIIKLPAVLKNYRKHNWVKNLTRQEPAAEPEALTQAAA